MDDLQEAVGVLDVPIMIERWVALLKGETFGAEVLEWEVQRW